MDRIARLIDNVGRVVVGKREQVVLAVVGLLAEGHLLLEDVPGTGKTTLARALAGSIDLRFRRIQFTADMLPSDVVGVSILDRGAGELRFQPGPVFGNVILADELNRTAPRTQSSLLECMNERQVSVDGITHPLPRPFMVIATQNPLEYEGTYPLPESQLDRFLLRLRLGYPERDDERRVLQDHVDGRPLDRITPVLQGDELLAEIELTRKVRMAPVLLEYLLDVVRGTREHADLELGCSTRAGLGLFRAAQALARVEGRDYCVPDDIKRLVLPVLGHRVLARSTADGAAAVEAALAALVDEVAVP